MAGRERDGADPDAPDRDGAGAPDRGEDSHDAPGNDSSADEDDRTRIRELREAAGERWGESPGDVERLAAELDSDDAEERAEATWALAELAEAESDSGHASRLPVESRLAPLLSDDDRWVRRGASWALATVAEDRPHRVRTAVSAVTESLTDEDPLVRENGVRTLAGVAEEYPRTAESALGRLGELVRNDEGLARRYAARTLRRLVARLADDGYPHTIEVSADLADVLPGDVDVVETTEDPTDGAVGVRDERESSEDDGENEREGDEANGGPGVGPPDQIPSPPEIDADYHDFERLADLGSDPLTAAAKARAPTTAEGGGQHAVVAVRRLRPDTGVDPDDFERALREWSGIDDHDHVAPVLAHDSSPGPWFATEFADGGTLRDHLGDVGRDRALWYAHSVVKAVCHAHARGVVHGALRPGAVGLSQTFGAWSVPKVGEWGLGDLLSQARSAPGRDSSARTPPVPTPYAAPEHLAPETFGRTDHATDVYQLGALCYALFTGRTPFVGDPRTVAGKIRETDPEPASEFAPELPSAVDDLLDRALTAEKQARFETAEDFRRELEMVLRKYGPIDP